MNVELRKGSMKKPMHQSRVSRGNADGTAVWSILIDQTSIDQTSTMFAVVCKLRPIPPPSAICIIQWCLTRRAIARSFTLDTTSSKSFSILRGDNVFEDMVQVCHNRILSKFTKSQVYSLRLVLCFAPMIRSSSSMVSPLYHSRNRRKR